MKHIRNKGNILASLITCLALTTSISALAEGKLVIPNVDEFQAGYGSIELLLNPCSHILDNDKDFINQVNEARKYLPTGTCDDPKLVNKLFKVNFLQNTLITMVEKPWELDKEITKQNKTINQCKDTKCLDEALDGAYNKLAPIYLAYTPNDKKPPSICIGDPSPADEKKYKTLENKLVEELNSVDNCNVEEGAGLVDNGVHYFDYTDVIPFSGGVGYKVCKSSIGDLFIASCPSLGNSANTQSWIYRLKQNSKPKLLFEADSSDGPFYELRTSCNGMPDLMTSARYNMGEHQISYYVYNGTDYQWVYTYMEEFTGQDSNGNDLAIAQYIQREQKEINCHVSK